jgi:hypothetical protein
MLIAPIDGRKSFPESNWIMVVVETTGNVWIWITSSSDAR